MIALAGLAGLALLTNQGYSKTVVLYYGNEPSFPSHITYSEYNDQKQAEYGGRLTITHIRPSNGGYYATYEGRLTAHHWQASRPYLGGIFSYQKTTLAT